MGNTESLKAQEVRENRKKQYKNKLDGILPFEHYKQYSRSKHGSIVHVVNKDKFLYNSNNIQNMTKVGNWKEYINYNGFSLQRVLKLNSVIENNEFIAGENDQTKWKKVMVNDDDFYFVNEKGVICKCNLCSVYDDSSFNTKLLYQSLYRMLL